jgi:hypothetical protein
MTTPTLPTDNRALKTAVRTGLSDRGRHQWYPLLPTIQREGIEVVNRAGYKQVLSVHRAAYTEAIKTALIATHSTDDRTTASKLSSTELSRPGVAKTHDICFLLSCTYGIRNADLALILPLVYSISNVVASIDVVFAMLTHILFPTREQQQGNQKSLLMAPPTIKSYLVKCHAFRYLLRRASLSTYQRLIVLDALTDEHLMAIFVKLFFSILPFPRAMIILDAFLLEGDKILYRYGMALLVVVDQEAKRKGMQFLNGKVKCLC